MHVVQCARLDGNGASRRPLYRAVHRVFVAPARAMSRMRGDPDYGLAIIDHPIVGLTKEELLQQARTAASQVIEHLVDQ